MLPLRDDVPTRNTPYVNYALVAVTSLVFLAQLLAESPMVEQYGMVPARLLDPTAVVSRESVEYVRTLSGIVQRNVVVELSPSAVHPWLTPLTCIFLHGGWLHFLGNMWILWIFGDNVEDRMGKLGYLGFYLGAGVAASLAHFAADTVSATPTIGASGAIAGVMGAYFVLYPRARVLVLVPIVFILEVLVLPAPVFLGIWFLIQVFSGFSGGQGVAWWAHVGGFVAGYIVGKALHRRDLSRPSIEVYRPGGERVWHYRVRRR